jgi:ankyrin repeat protein
MKLLSVALALCLAACAGTAARDATIDYSALYYAARGGNTELVKALLERGASVNAPPPDSAGNLSYHAALFNSPLQVAAEGGYVEIVELLLTRKPWLDVTCCGGPTALGFAAEKGHLKIVEMLLAAGADPTVTSTDPTISDYYNQNGPSTPLDVARAAGHVEVVRVLEVAMKAWSRPTIRSNK